MSLFWSKNYEDAKDILSQLSEERVFEMIFKSSLEEALDNAEHIAPYENVFLDTSQEKYYGITPIYSDKFTRHLRKNFGIEAKGEIEYLNEVPIFAIKEAQAENLIKEAIEKNPKKLLSGLEKRFNIKALHKKYHQNIDDFMDGVENNSS